MVCITEVAAHSLAQKSGILAGDYLISINEHPICDVLDYRFYLTESRVTLRIHREAQLFDVTIEKDEYEDIGLDFSTFLMDEKRSCRNKCIFCFIDQLPKGMREPLYFKDDDSRLSFLMGNYITLTNLSEADVARIVEMKTSPMHVSVHTTDPDLRVQMMKNPRAGACLSILQRFAAAGITMDCQIVLCRDVNDGAALTRTMEDLATLYPHVESVSVVPSGLTDHREGLYPLRPFDAQSARQTIAQVEAFADACYERLGSRIFFCADELYVKAGLPLHDEDYYEGYPQLENGVGMMTSMQTEFADALVDVTEADCPAPRTVSVATGESAYVYMQALCARLCARVPNLTVSVYCVKNHFFGKNITVAGLLCGKDLREQLVDKDLGQELLLPAVTLRHERDLFLDDVSREQLQADLGVPLTFVENDGMALLDALLGREISF